MVKLILLDHFATHPLQVEDLKEVAAVATATKRLKRCTTTTVARTTATTGTLTFQMSICLNLLLAKLDLLVVVVMEAMVVMEANDHHKIALAVNR